MRITTTCKISFGKNSQYLLIKKYTMILVVWCRIHLEDEKLDIDYAPQRIHKLKIAT